MAEEKDLNDTFCALSFVYQGQKGEPGDITDVSGKKKYF